MAAERSLEDLLEAGKRVADKAFEAMRKLAEQQLFSADRTGRLGSSSHLAAEEKIFLDGYEKLCGNATDRIADLATENAEVYLAPLKNLLRQYWTPVANAFLDHAAPGQSDGMVRNEANKIANMMDGKLEKVLDAALADFQLRFPLGGAPMASPSTASERPTNTSRAMGYSATVLKVMIASPSDVAAERVIVRDVVHEWNAINSEDRSIVLVPVGWESHSSPAMGAHPQEIINKQVLKGCDLLVAVFWTKLGTPTAKAGSGTAEEIDEHLGAGKPALLYFSSEPVVLDSIDLKQYHALKAFEAQKLKEGLIERYETKAEFREKLSRQLAQTIIREFGKGNDGGVGVERDDSATRDADDVAPSIVLSEAARELLLEATHDKDGVIMRVQYIGGSDVQTNGRQFISLSDARTVALWRGAVDELENLGLIEDRSGKGEVFFMTNEGYQSADQLALGR